MTKINLFIAIVFLAFACTSSTSAQTKESRDVSGFNAIDVSEGIEVVLTIGDTESVEVTAPEDYIDMVITEVSGTELNIYIKGNNIGNKGRNVVVNVVAKEIQDIESSSGSSVKTTNTIKTEELEISVSSGADVNIACDVNEVSISASSGAGAKVHGTANSVDAGASSGSHIKAGDLIAQDVEADVSSGGSISVHAEKQIDADASSGGSVSYSGSPELVDVEKSSGGSVRKK